MQPRTTRLILVTIVTAIAASDNAWCNQPSFQKNNVSSPHLLTCDNSDLMNEISSLRQEIQQSCDKQVINEEPTQHRQQIQECNIYAVLEEIRQLREEIRALKPGSSPSKSCNEIFDQNNKVISGSYWLQANGNPVNVTCNFDVQLPPSNSVRGWQQLANFNFSDPSQSCPYPLREVSSPTRRCGKSSETAGCDSVNFPTSGVPFSKLCGQTIGYATGSADAFTGWVCGDPCTINDPYVDGISITYGEAPNREHIWTLVAEQVHSYSRCPCGSVTLKAHERPPSFVGNDSYCEVAQSNTTPLWDGQGCTGTDEACCENTNLPWFCREFDEPVTADNIEVRLCTDEGRANEDIELGLIQLYIQ